MSKQQIVNYIKAKLNNMTAKKDGTGITLQSAKTLMDTTCSYTLFIWLYPNFRKTVIGRIYAPDFGSSYSEEQRTKWMNTIHNVSKINYREFCEYYEIKPNASVNTEAKLEYPENRDDDLLPEEVLLYLEPWQYSRINCFRKHYSSKQFGKIYDILLKEKPAIALEFVLYHVWARLSNPQLQQWCEENCEPGNQYAGWLYNFTNLTVDEIETFDKN